MVNGYKRDEVCGNTKLTGYEEYESMQVKRDIMWKIHGGELFCLCCIPLCEEREKIKEEAVR